MEEYNIKTTNPTAIMPIKIRFSIIVLSAFGQTDLNIKGGQGLML